MLKLTENSKETLAVVRDDARRAEASRSEELRRSNEQLQRSQREHQKAVQEITQKVAFGPSDLAHLYY